MDDGLKQRLIGAIVLVALGVIFIPSLVNQEGRREIDLTTQVPPEPVVMPRPLELQDPVRPVNVPQPKNVEENYKHDEKPELRQPVTIISEDESTTIEPPPAQVAETTSVAQVAPEIPDSSLTEEGIPVAWSIQVSSFQSAQNANNFETRLNQAGYPAYVRESSANGTTVYRVYVGPKINRQTALDTKTKIDNEFRTQSLLVEFKP